jgi:hypothetical protein
VVTLRKRCGYVAQALWLRCAEEVVIFFKDPRNFVQEKFKKVQSEKSDVTQDCRGLLLTLTKRHCAICV